MPVRLSEILQRTPPVSADISARAVFNIFLSDVSIKSIAVVDGSNPIGLVTRANLSEQLAGPNGTTMLAGQPISMLMDTKFAAVDVHRTVAAVASRASELESSALVDGLIAVHQAKYAGIITPEAILTVLAKENSARAKAMKNYGRKLELAQKSASQQSDDASRFMAMLSHEIRTPLTGVLGVADMLVDAGLQEEHKRYAQTIASSGRLLDRLLTDMTDLSRMEAGKLEINAAPLNLREFASEARDLWAAKTADKKLTLKISIAKGSEKRVMVDGMRLRQILFNLMSNALKFTEKGYVEVELATRKNASGELILTMKVSDTGCGIADEHKERLFKEFEQASRSIASIHGGTGLGLSISKGLAELMGGSIQLTDNPEGGSVFTVEVGVEELGPRLAVDNPKKRRRGRLELGSILVIEDHRVSQMVIEKALSAAGWTVDCVYTGDQGVRRAGAKRYQAILIDRHLPDGMGEEILARIRSEALACHNVPALLVTADVSPERRDAAQSEGFDSFIAKPIRPRELVAALADVLMEQDAGQIVRRANAL